jgi:hypothetical protein
MKLIHHASSSKFLHAHIHTPDRSEQKNEYIMDTPSSKVFTIKVSRTLPTAVVELPPEATVADQAVTNHSSVHLIKTCYQWLANYLKKFRGLRQERPKRLPWDEYLWSFIGALLGIAAVAFLHSKLFEP